MQLPSGRSTLRPVIKLYSNDTTGFQKMQYLFRFSLLSHRSQIGDIVVDCPKSLQSFTIVITFYVIIKISSKGFIVYKFIENFGLEIMIGIKRSAISEAGI